jgi:hypothetical protein
LKLKYIFLIYLIINLTAIGHAGPISIGLKGGLNSSNVDGRDGIYFGDNYATGLNLGLFGEVVLNKNFSIQPEIFYTEKGDQLYSSALFYNYYYSFKYLGFSGLLKADIVSVGHFNVNVLLGPYVAFLLNESYRTYPVSNQTSPLSGDFNNLDVGYVLGIGFELENFVFESRFEHELNNLYDGHWFNHPINDVANQVFAISAGYKFLSL